MIQIDSVQLLTEGGIEEEEGEEEEEKDGKNDDRDGDVSVDHVKGPNLDSRIERNQVQMSSICHTANSP